MIAMEDGSFEDICPLGKCELYMATFCLPEGWYICVHSPTCLSMVTGPAYFPGRSVLWFPLFCMFTPTWRQDPIWQTYFSSGWFKQQRKGRKTIVLGGWFSIHFFVCWDLIPGLRFPNEMYARFINFFLGGEPSNIVYVQPYKRGNDPFWLRFF